MLTHMACFLRLQSCQLFPLSTNEMLIFKVQLSYTGDARRNLRLLSRRFPKRKFDASAHCVNYPGWYAPRWNPSDSAGIPLNTSSYLSMLMIMSLGNESYL